MLHSLFFWGTFFLIFANDGQAFGEISANNGVLLDLKTGEVLYEKQAHKQQSVASLTKVMTAIIAIESNSFSEQAIVSRRAIYTGGSSIYLEQGEKMTIEDLTYGLMLRSGNDAAVAIAEHIGGSVEGFVYLMNEKAKWLGMTNTHFANPHGLESENHYSTAYDLAILMRYAMDNEIFRHISSTKKYLSDQRSYYWMNKNKLLTHLYKYCTGGKTGFTKKAGRTLITTAKKDNIELIAVTLNAGNDWQEHIQMYEWGFAQLVEKYEYEPSKILSDIPSKTITFKEVQAPHKHMYPGKFSKGIKKDQTPHRLTNLMNQVLGVLQKIARIEGLEL